MIRRQRNIRNYAIPKKQDLVNRKHSQTIYHQQELNIIPNSQNMEQTKNSELYKNVRELSKENIAGLENNVDFKEQRIYNESCYP